MAGIHLEGDNRSTFFKCGKKQYFSPEHSSPSRCRWCFRLMGPWPDPAQGPGHERKRVCLRSGLTLRQVGEGKRDTPSLHLAQPPGSLRAAQGQTLPPPGAQPFLEEVWLLSLRMWDLYVIALWVRDSVSVPHKCKY